MNNIEIIRAFKQGSTGNCVCIAIIKAGIEVFGLNNIFYLQKEDDNVYHFMHRDGFEEKITSQEIASAKEGSLFEVLQNEEIYNYSVLCFATMAKRAQVENSDDNVQLTYEQAIATLNDGEFYLHGPQWLGLRHNYRNIGRKYARNNPGCVGASRKHCFYISYGIEDKYGEPDRVSRLERNFAQFYRLSTEQIF